MVNLHHHWAHHHGHIDADGLVVEQSNCFAVSSGGDRALGVGLLPYQESDAFVIREETTFAREFAYFAGRRRIKSLGSAEEAGRKDR